MKHTQGSIEVICGSMFSGKTDELIRRLVRATIAKQKVHVFKPAIDVRYAAEKVTSHAGSNYDAQPVERAADIRTRLEKDTTVVGIDEAQFFDAEIVSVAQELAKRGIRVLAAGLDMDFRGEPFGPMPALQWSTPPAQPACRKASCGIIAECCTPSCISPIRFASAFTTG